MFDHCCISNIYHPYNSANDSNNLFTGMNVIELPSCIIFTKWLNCIQIVINIRYLRLQIYFCGNLTLYKTECRKKNTKLKSPIYNKPLEFSVTFSYVNSIGLSDCSLFCCIFLWRFGRTGGLSTK